MSPKEGSCTIILEQGAVRELRLLSRHIRKISVAMLPFFWFGFAVGAYAQQALDAGAIQREVEKNMSQQLAEPLPGIEAVQKEVPVEKKGPVFTLQKINFEGNSVIPSDELVAIVDVWIGQKISMNELEVITAKVSAQYRVRGYLAKVYLPEQDIKNGVVVVNITEAMFGGIIVQGGGVIKDDYLKKLVQKSQQEAGLVNVEGLERAALIINDTPGVKAKTVLSASDKMGYSNVQINVEDEPRYSGLISLDNYGGESTGETQLSPYLQIANLLGRGDSIVINGLVSNDNRYARVRYDEPLGYDGLRIGGSVSYLDYGLSSQFSAIGAEGDAATITADLIYPLVRKTKKNIRLTGSLTFRNNEDSQLGVVVSDKNIYALNMSVNGDWVDEFGQGGITFYGASIVVGDVDLSGNTINEAQDAAGSRTADSYSKFGFNVGRLQSVNDYASLYLSFSGQVSRDSLDSSESISLGGAYGIRAYPTAEANGDDGFVFTAEYRRQLSRDLRVSAFVDYGQMTSKSTQVEPANTTSLKGVGMSVDWSLPQNFSSRFIVSRRLGNNPLGNPITGNDTDGSYELMRIWATISKNF